MELAVEVYALTSQFPPEERYGLSSQLRRAAVSIPSNIAEGRYRGTKKDFLNFLRVAYGSGAELETHIEIAKRLPQITQLNYAKVSILLEETMKMLNAMIRRLNPISPRRPKANEAKS